MRERARIPNAPLREAFLASGMTADQVCRELDWFDERVTRTAKPEITRLTRSLGLAPGGGQKPGTRQQLIGIEKARRIAEAMNVDLSLLYPDELAPAGTPCAECGEPMWEATAEGICGWCIEERDLNVAC